MPTTKTRKDFLLELLWDYMKRDPEHKDRVRTGYGTKTKKGLAASVEAVFWDQKEALQAMVTAYAWNADWSKPETLHSAVRKAGEALGLIKVEDFIIDGDHFNSREVEALVEAGYIERCPDSHRRCPNDYHVTPPYTSDDLWKQLAKRGSRKD